MARTPYLPAATLPDEDWFADDPALARFLQARVPPPAWKDLEAHLSALGRVAPRDVDPLAREADAHGPTLGARGEVVLGASYRKLQEIARRHRVFTLSWHPLGGQAKGSRVACFGLGYLFAQAEAGYYCPACMTDGAAFVLARSGPRELSQRYVPRLVQDDVRGAYEGGMLLTETTGGSDVGASTTEAVVAADGSWRLTGDKWFVSNANAEVMLTLARPANAPPGTKGLGLYLIPSVMPNGEPNPGLTCTRLKEKLGVRSMATAEVELRGAYAEQVAPPPHGFKAMVEMVNLSRLYNSVTSVAVMRRALREGQKNGAWREAFGKPLQQQPLYERAIAELAVDTRAALFFVLDTAAVFDRAFDHGDEKAYKLLRALTPLAKAETAKLAVAAASEGCEFLGGNGYVEEWVTPRLLRDAQVLTIWEGTTNVQALDFVRACKKEDAASLLLDDSLARTQDHGGGELAQRWKGWYADVMHARPDREREMAARRLLAEAYRLRAATLLLEDSFRDRDETADLFAEAYMRLRLRRDDSAFERLVAENAATFTAWPRVDSNE